MTSSARKKTTITVDGQLMGEYADAVENWCTQESAQGRPVHLLLREVVDIDERGRAMLARMAALGVSLNAAGIYSSYIVAAICRENQTAPGTDTNRTDGSSKQAKIA
jgi:hypothetical protein